MNTILDDRLGIIEKEVKGLIELIGISVQTSNLNQLLMGNAAEQRGVTGENISPLGMLKAFERVGIKSDHLCTYCIGGKKPF